LAQITAAFCRAGGGYCLENMFSCFPFRIHRLPSPRVELLSVLCLACCVRAICVWQATESVKSALAFREVSLLGVSSSLRQSRQPASSLVECRLLCKFLIPQLIHPLPPCDSSHRGYDRRRCYLMLTRVSSAFLLGPSNAIATPSLYAPLVFRLHINYSSSIVIVLSFHSNCFSQGSAFLRRFLLLPFFPFLYHYTW